MIHTLAIANYRSLRDLVIGLSELNVITGHNGSGKSNLYRALRLLTSTARGEVVSTLAREGGLASTLWAGPELISKGMKTGEVPVQGTRRKKVVALKLGFASDDYGFSVELGLPAQGRSLFHRDPEIKRECLWVGPILRPNTVLIDRKGPLVRAQIQRKWSEIYSGIESFESMMNEVGDTHQAPAMVELRERIRKWRFYDHFRSDLDAPARRTQVGTRTPVLSHDGHDLAAAWQTIIEIGDEDALRQALDRGFPGASVHIEERDCRFTLAYQQPGLLRPLAAEELSDGTLRYLLWIAALLSPRPPELMVLNEPETSLHPSLVIPLAHLIRDVSRQTQIITVSHNQNLVDTLCEHESTTRIEVYKELGETLVKGQTRLERPLWSWSRGS